MFQASDLFFIPLLFLLGFVFVANFLLKLSDCVRSLVPRTGPSLDEILAETRNMKTAATHDEDDLSLKLEHAVDNDDPPNTPNIS